MRRKFFTTILSVCLVSSALCAFSNESDRLRPRFFEGSLSVLPVPLVGQEATISLDLTALASDCESATIQFRTPAGVAILGHGLSKGRYLAKGQAHRYSADIQVLEEGSYALQATVYFRPPDGERRAEHFFTYLLAGRANSQARDDQTFPLTKRRTQMGMLAPPAVTGPASGGTVTISGYITYYDDNLSRELPIRRVRVDLLEENERSLQQIDSTYTDDSGFYSFENVSNVDPEDGTGRDVQLRIPFVNDALRITDAAGSLHSVQSFTMHNVSDGHLNSDYFLDSKDQYRGLGHVFNCVMDAYDFLQDRFNWGRAGITIRWPSGGWSEYRYGYTEFLKAIVQEHIQLPAGQQWNRPTILHEYGHAVMTALYRYREDYLPPISPRGTHYMHTVSDLGFAMREGWAEFFEALVDDNAYNVTAYPNADTPNIESNSWWTGSPDGGGSNTRGEIVEGAVASVLWDIADTQHSRDGSPGLDDDGMAGLSAEVWKVMMNHRPRSILEFWDHWVGDGYGQAQSLYSVYTSHSIGVTPLWDLNNPPELASTGHQQIGENMLLQLTITAMDADAADILTYSAQPIPPGASWDPNARQFHWTPDHDLVATAERSRSFHVTFKVTDNQGASDQETVTITVDNVNRPPEARALILPHASPSETDDLTCSYDYADADGDAESKTQIEWYRDGDLQASCSDQKVVSSTATAAGQQWHFTVKPKDGVDFGELRTSNVVTIVDTTTPVITLAPSVADITSASALVLWSTNEICSSVVEYGSVIGYGLMAEGTGNITDHSVPLVSLSANITYYYRVASTDASGNTAWSGQKTFKSAGIKGDVNNDGEVLSNDAALVLLIAAELMSPSDYQKWAADMNNDAQVGSNDAVLILRNIGFPAPGRSVAEKASGPVTLTLAESHGVAGESIGVPLMLDDTNGLGGGDVSIHYDRAVLCAVAVPSDSGVMVASNISEPGTIRIAFAGTGRLNHRTLAEIQFHVLADDISPLVVRGVQLYGTDALPLRSRCINRKFSSCTVSPEHSALLQNFPNPFNPDTWIPYQLKADTGVMIRLYGTTGQHIRTLNLGHKRAGFYISRERAAYWDGRNEAGEQVASGVYFCVIQTGDHTARRKMFMSK